MIRLSADFKRQASSIGRTRTGSRRSLANGEWPQLAEPGSSARTRQSPANLDTNFPCRPSRVNRQRIIQCPLADTQTPFGSRVHLAVQPLDQCRWSRRPGLQPSPLSMPRKPLTARSITCLPTCCRLIVLMLYTPCRKRQTWFG